MPNYFAQKNYPQQLGNGKYNIEEAGCLLTSICNGLLTLNGTAPDPPTLDQWYEARNDFIMDPDGAREDLAANSITKYDPTIVNTSIVNGSMPPYANAIVKFHYNSVHTHEPIDHFCWVNKIEGNQLFIVDSWDGAVKSPADYQSVYGVPIAYYTYQKNIVTPVPAITAPPPAPKPPAGAMPIPSAEVPYAIVKTILGFSSATDAGNHTNARGTVDAGNYFIFNTYPTNPKLINVTKVVGSPGSWINAEDNVPDVEEAAPAVPKPVIPDSLIEDEAAFGPNAWKTTYTAYKDTKGNLSPETYVIMFAQTPIINGDSGQTKTITKNKNGETAQYEPILIAGTVIKNGVTYLRPQNNNADQGLWWLIPQHDALGRQYIMLESDVYNPRTTTAERVALKNTKFVDNFVRFGAFLSNTIDKIKKI